MILDLVGFAVLIICFVSIGFALRNNGKKRNSKVCVERKMGQSVLTEVRCDSSGNEEESEDVNDYDTSIK